MVLGIALGLLHANAVEWLTHKYVLHGLGRKKGSMWRFHWAQHHRIARKNGMLDKSYEEPFWRWSARGKEIAGILGLAALHLPLLSVAPFFTAAVVFSSGNYLYRHRKAHVDVEWGKKHMPHHYDHHMGPNQDANWCVSYPWFDYLLGTREVAPPAAYEKHRGDAPRKAAVETASSNEPAAEAGVRLAPHVRDSVAAE